ncbi:M48 family metalloprotease [Paludibacterium purpuratum]|uniref:Putative Zn-dependent protease n=1 Tax=Paludibacterium purpuratum TaxID=1144873 RepID=A0A4R7B718_9NEIS|nr:M48 family metalloprotease [Paludibacterium purpuratum]TDR80530.1 putative Zn-dependent protease [Paludibacterium purpuratum]
MKKTFLLTTISIGLLLIAGGVRAELPDLGDVSQASMSLADEARIGRNAMRELRQQDAISDDPELAMYINSLGARLAAGAVGSGIRFTFFVVNDGSINAFAMPGGYIGVNKGLIMASQSEGELASVLGHEMAHVTQHHMARMQANTLPNQLTLLATLVAAALASRAHNSDAVMGTINAGIGLTLANQLSFSRDFEREADRVGMQYLAAAGFDVRDMPGFFSRMQQSEHLNGGDAYAFLRTHPVTVERISEAQNRSLNAPVRMRVSGTDYLLVREKIRNQLLAPTEASKYYQTALANRQYLNEGAQWYGLAMARERLHDQAGAAKALGKARQILPASPMLYTLEAAIDRSGKNWDGALAAYKTGLARYPGFRPLSDDEVDLLIQLGQREQALQKIRHLQQTWPADPALYRLQSRLYADSDMLRYHAALGNALYFELQYEPALEQFRLASQAPGDDFYLRSSIEARSRELEKLVADSKRDGTDQGDGQ